jgi:hypothetical protein
VTGARTVLRGRWPCDRVTVNHVASTRVVDPVIEHAVAQEWTRQRQLADRQGRRLVDAPAYRLESAIQAGDVLTLGLALEPYRLHSALKVLHADPRVRTEHHDRTLVPDALVRTCDDHYVLLRTAKVTGPELQLVGGTASPERWPIASGVDLAAATEAWVADVLGTDADVEVQGVLGVVEQEIGCVCVVMDVRVAEAASCLVPRSDSQLVAVRDDDLLGFLRAAPGYLPAVAHLL